MHCTVQPGKYCTLFPPLERRAIFSDPAPWTGNPTENLPGFCAECLVVSSGKIQFLVVELQRATLHYSGGLQVEPAPDSGGLQVEPAPDSGGLRVEPAPVKRSA